MIKAMENERAPTSRETEGQREEEKSEEAYCVVMEL